MISQDEYQDKVGFFLTSEGEVIEHADSMQGLINCTEQSKHLSDKARREIVAGMLEQKHYIIRRAEYGHGGKRLISNRNGVKYYVVVVQPDESA